MNFREMGIRHFKEDEFPPGELGLADRRIIIALDEYRHILGKPVVPSPVAGALARVEGKDKGSRHYAVNRLSDAVDVFPQCNIADAWRVAVQSGLFGGVGFYLDTKPSPMLHFDLRDVPAWWCRVQGKYIYPANAGDRERFFRALAGAAINGYSA